MFSASLARRRSRVTGSILAAVIAGAALQVPAAAQASIAPAAVPSLAPAQPPQTSLGDDFWLAFPANVYNGGGLGTVLYLSGAEAGAGTVQIPGSGFSEAFTIIPGEVAQVAIPFADSVTASDGVQALGIHVTADTSIAVYGVNQQPQTSGAYLGLPVSALGSRYRALGYNGLAGFGESELTVVATADDTTVTVTPKENLGSHPAGTPFDVVLDQGDVYQLRASGGGDISGTVVESSSPVAVYGGALCANVPVGTAACDHLVQQLTPTAAWGSDFLSVRFAIRTKGDTYRVLANEDDTEVSVNGTPVATINSGEFYEAVLPESATAAGSEGTSIHTSHPTLVAQYGNGANYDNSTGDPLMMLVPPAGQYLDRYTFAAPDVPGYSPYTNLVVPTTDVALVSLDGALVDSSSFSPIPGSSYSGAQLALPAGTHTLRAPDPFGLQVYEWGEYDGFGFPGGMALRDIYVDPQGPLTADDLTSSAPAPGAQQATATIPEGGSITLLDGGDSVTEVVLPDVGTYTLDPDTGVITFTPVPGYVGSPDPVTYQITDADERTAQATYSPTVTEPVAPTPADLESSGVGTDEQSVTVEIPEGGSVTLLDGDTETDTVVLEGIGSYRLDPETGVITFTAVLGYSGSPAPVTYQVTDSNELSGTATYAPEVVAPDGPSADPVTSSGTGTNPQSVTIPVPTGGSIALLDEGGLPVTEVVIEGVGTYVVNPETGTISFVADAGFSGEADPVTYQLTDAYDQTDTAEYTPTVAVPAPPTAEPMKSHGEAGQLQTVMIDVPPGGTAYLLDENGEPTDKVVVRGEGTYRIDPETGELTFDPANGFEGQAAGVAYRITDAYGQSDQARYTPRVRATAIHRPSKLKVTAPGMVKLTKTRPARVPTICRIRHGKASVCNVVLTARVNGDRTVIGRGHTRSRATHGARRIRVVVHLTKLGKALAARPGGVGAVVAGSARRSATNSWMANSDTTRVVKRVTPISRAVYFDVDSAKLRPGDRGFLRRLRTHLNGVKVVVCHGYTDNMGVSNEPLGMRRAKSACAFLVGNKSIATRLASYGESRPAAPNDTGEGRALNRRAQIILKY